MPRKRKVSIWETKPTKPFELVVAGRKQSFVKRYQHLKFTLDVFDPESGQLRPKQTTEETELFKYYRLSADGELIDPTREQERRHNETVENQLAELRRQKEKKLRAPVLPPALPEAEHFRTDFLELFETCVEQMRVEKRKAVEAEGDSRYESQYATNYVSTLNHLRRFAKFGEEHLSSRPIIFVSDLTPELLERFQQYLRDKGLSSNTTSKYIDCVSAICTDLVEARILNHNPASMMKNRLVADFRTLTNPELTDQEFLELIEMRKIWENRAVLESEKDTTEAFLFCCMTGLRWGDIEELKPEHIKVLMPYNRRYIDKVLRKRVGKRLVKVRVMIPLNRTAEYLLDIVLERRNPDPSQVIFFLHDNNGANKHVEKLAVRLELGKHIHWHTSRHTFSSNLFGKAEDVIVDQMLGHLPPKNAIKQIHYDRTSFKRMPQLHLRAVEHLEFLRRYSADGEEVIPEAELKKAYML